MWFGFKHTYTDNVVKKVSLTWRERSLTKAGDKRNSNFL